MKKTKAFFTAIMTALLLSGSAYAIDLEYKDCTSADKTAIRSAVVWLKNNISKVDAKMGKNKLMDWPGKSRGKFLKKLDKKLKFVCKHDKNKCLPNEDGTVLFGKVVPVFKQRTIQLCTQNFSGQQHHFVGTIAHEIAHLIRLNAHRLKCKDKYTKPRFSQSVGLAAKHAYRSTAYNASDYTRYCP